MSIRTLDRVVPGRCGQAGAVDQERMADDRPRRDGVDPGAGRGCGLRIQRVGATRAAAGWRVCADASRLPISDATMAAVVLGDAARFAAEVVWVLTARRVECVGRDAQHHVPPRTVVEALTVAAGRQWSAVESEAGWGSWVVLRRD